MGKGVAAVSLVVSPSSASGPLKVQLASVERRPVLTRVVDAVGPAVEVLPRLTGAVDVDVAEHVDHDAVLEQLDRVVTVDVRRTARVVGREPEERS